MVISHIAVELVGLSEIISSSLPQSVGIFVSSTSYTAFCFFPLLFLPSEMLSCESECRESEYQALTLSPSLLHTVNIFIAYTVCTHIHTYKYSTHEFRSQDDKFDVTLCWTCQKCSSCIVSVVLDLGHLGPVLKIHSFWKHLVNHRKPHQTQKTYPSNIIHENRSGVTTAWVVSRTLLHTVKHECL